MGKTKEVKNIFQSKPEEKIVRRNRLRWHEEVRK
jgi:hypothetical protein